MVSFRAEKGDLRDGPYPMAALLHPRRITAWRTLESTHTAFKHSSGPWYAEARWGWGGSDTLRVQRKGNILGWRKFRHVNTGSGTDCRIGGEKFGARSQAVEVVVLQRRPLQPVTRHGGSALAEASSGFLIVKPFFTAPTPYRSKQRKRDQDYSTRYPDPR